MVFQIIFVILLVLFDQITKSFFDVTKNYGAAFGLAINKWTLIIVSVMVLVICIYYLLKIKQKIVRYGLFFLIAGALGNLIDRLMFGYVRDFIGIWIIPRFNFADIFNIIGALLLIYFLLKERPSQRD